MTETVFNNGLLSAVVVAHFLTCAQSVTIYAYTWITGYAHAKFNNWKILTSICFYLTFHFIYIVKSSETQSPYRNLVLRNK